MPLPEELAPYGDDAPRRIVPRDEGWLAAEMRRERDQRLKQTIVQAPPPEQVARTTVAARDANVPPALIEGRVDEAVRSQNADRLNALGERYPAIGRFTAANPRAAVAAQDDHESLGILGSAWDFLKNAPGRVFGAGGYGLAGMISDTYGGVQEWNDMAMSPLWAAMSAVSQASGIRVLDPEKALRYRERQRAESHAAFTAASERSREANRGGNWVTEGLLSGTESIPLTIGAVATRNPEAAANVMGTLVGGNAYANARAEGVAPATALRYGAAQGLVEKYTEQIPAGTLIDLIARKTPWAKSFVRELGQEMTGEQIATALQDLNDWAVLPENRDKTFSDYVAARPQAALSTALAVAGGTGATTVGIGAVQRATDATVRVADRVAQVRQARSERQFIDRAERAAEGSKLRQRDPEAFRALLQQQAEEAGATHLFIPGEAVKAYQQSDSYDEFNDPFASYNTDEAASTGGDIVVPIADALTDFVGTPAWKAVKDDVRLAPGGMSSREADAFNAAMDDVMAELGDKAAAQDATEAGRRTVREKIVSRVADMFGVSFTSPTARTIAELFAQRLQTRAARQGKEISESDLDGFQVRQVMPEGVAEAVKADKLDLVVNAMRQRKDAGVAAEVAPQSEAIAIPSEAAQGDMLDAGAGQSHRFNVVTIPGDGANTPNRFMVQRLVFENGEAARVDVLTENGWVATDPQQAASLADLFDTNSDAEAFGERALLDGLTERQAMLAQREPVRQETAEQFAARIKKEKAQRAAGITPASEVAPSDPMRQAADDLRAMLEDAGLNPDAMSDAEVRAAVDGMQSEGSADALQDLGDTVRGQIKFEGSKRIIELFQSRTLATPLHELSHMWLEELAFDASLPDAPEQVKADWETAKRYFAANGHKVGKDGQIPVEAHELWARSGERYFMEGKAPTSALVRLFESFRGWLVNIYKTVDKLRAPITPEIREVFDRLLATDEEIAAVQERQGLEALFKDAAAIGMSEPEFQAYQQQVDDARAGAHASLLDKTMRTIRRREEERYRDARKAIKAEETERIDGSPIFKALATMKDQRISREWVVDEFGQEGLDALPVRVPPLHTPGGVHPDAIAEQSGYASGQEMIEALIGAERAHRQAREGGDTRSMRERAIESATNEEFARRYGDPLNDGSIEREALGAVHSEMQGEVIASEIRVLARKTGQRPTPYRIARDWARGKVRSGVVAQEASPSAIQRYARNAAKAAKAAEAAFLKQDVDEAFRQKQFQMLNNALLAEAKEAADEVNSAVKRMDKIARAKTRKSVDQDYLEQAHALLEAVDLKERTQKSVERQGKWESFAAAREAEGYDVVVPASFEATLGKTHWSRLTVENLLALDEAVKQVIHLGRLKQTLLDGKEEREWDAVIGEAVDGAGNLKGPPPQGLDDPNWRAALGAKVAGTDAALLKMETIFDWLDGGKSDGTFNRVAFRPVADAQSAEQDMLKDYYARVKALFEAVPGDQVSKWSDKVRPPFIDKFTGKPMRLKRQKIVAMALNIGNEGNLQRLADGFGIDAAALETYLASELTAEEWQFVQGVWDTIETLWPQIEAMERRVNGIAPEKVEVRQVVTPHGTFRGGYYPAVYDTKLDPKAEENAGKESDLFEAKYTRATTRASATKDRSEKVTRPILLDLGVINRHLGEVIHDITHREAVMQAHRFLTNSRVTAAVDAALGREYREQFRPWVKFVANSWAMERAGNEGFGNWIGKLRANATAVGLGLRATTMVTQLAGYSNSIEVVGEAWMAKGIAQFSAHPVETFRFVMERSGEVRHRMDTLDRDLRTEIARLSAKNPVSKGVAHLDEAKVFMFHGIGLMDRAVSIPTWIAGYNKALSEGSDETDAAYAGDKAVRVSQGAGAPKDLAAIQRGTGKWGEALKLFTMFYSYFSAMYQRERTLGRDIGGKDTRRQRNMPRLAARAFWLLVVPPLLVEVLKMPLGAGGPDDDEWWLQWVTRKLLANAIGPIPMARDVFEPAWQSAIKGKFFNPAISPVQRVYDTIIKSAGDTGKIVRGDETKHATKDYMETAGYVTGLVPGQVASATQFLVDVGSGDADPEGFSDWLEGLSRGKIEAE